MHDDTITSDLCGVILRSFNPYPRTPIRCITASSCLYFHTSNLLLSTLFYVCYFLFLFYFYRLLTLVLSWRTLLHPMMNHFSPFIFIPNVQVMFILFPAWNRSSLQFDLIQTNRDHLKSHYTTCCLVFQRGISFTENVLPKIAEEKHHIDLQRKHAFADFLELLINRNKCWQTPPSQNIVCSSQSAFVLISKHDEPKKGFDWRGFIENV